jgi:hypothetical protein
MASIAPSKTNPLVGLSPDEAASLIISHVFSGCRMSNVPLANPKVSVFTHSALIRPFPMPTLFHEGWHWESLDMMADTLTQAMHLGWEAFRAELEAQKLRKAMDRRGQVPENHLANLAANRDDSRAVEAYMATSRASIAAATAPICRLVHIIADFMKDPAICRTRTVGDILGNVLARIDTKKLDAQTAIVLPVEVPVQPLPSFTNLWTSSGSGQDPQVVRVIAPTRMTWRGGPSVASRSIVKPNPSARGPSAQIVGPTPTPFCMKRRRGLNRGKGPKEDRVEHHHSHVHSSQEQ